MLRIASKQLALLALLAGLLLRAATPLGYMPAIGGSGLLFELCPEQSPIAFAAMASTNHAHHHHGSDSASEEQSSADLCQVGHLLFSAIAVDTDTIGFFAQAIDAPEFELTQSYFEFGVVTNYRSRAPPS